MKLFNKLRRTKDNSQNQDLLIDEPFILKVTWDELPPKEAIGEVDQILSAKGMPTVTQTNPIFSIAQLELLLEAILNTRVAGEAAKGDYIIPHIELTYQQDDDQVGIDNVIISLSKQNQFENLTTLVADAVFNTLGGEINYDNLVEFVSTFNDSYKTQMGVDNDEVATIPSMYDLETAQKNNSKIETHLPTTMESTVFEEEKDYEDSLGTTGQGLAVENSEHITKSEMDHDDQSNKIGESNQKEDGTAVVKESNSLPSNGNTEAKHLSKEISGNYDIKDEYGDNDLNISDQQPGIEDSETGIIKEILTTYPIKFPYFNTAPLEHKEPGETGYVNYMLNQDKLAFNMEFKQRQRAYQDKFKAELSDIQQDLTLDLNDKLANFLKEVDHRDQIHEAVVAEVRIKRNGELKNEKTKIEQAHDEQVARENERHKNALAEIDRSRDSQIQQATQEIDERMNNLTESLERKRLSEQTHELINQRNEFIKNAQDGHRVDVEKYAAKRSAELNEYGAELLNKAKKTLDKNQSTYTNEHYNANQADAALKRAETEQKKVTADYDEYRRAENELADMKAVVSGLKSENATLKNQLVNAKSQTNSDNLTAMITALAASNNGKSQSNDQLPALFKAVLESQSQKQPVAVNQKDKQNWIIGGLISFAAILMLGMGGLFVSNQNSKFEQLQSQNNQTVQMLQETKKENHKLNNSLQQETSKREAAEDEAESAKDQAEKVADKRDSSGTSSSHKDETNRNQDD